MRLKGISPFCLRGNSFLSDIFIRIHTSWLSNHSLNSGLEKFSPFICFSILNNMLFISINVLASMFTISIIISLSGCCKNRIEGCGTQKTIIKVHNMTSDIIAQPPDYADWRELKSLSYFGN